MQTINMILMLCFTQRRFIATAAGKPLYRLKTSFEKELVVQKSRFIAKISPCSSFEEAMEFIQSEKDDKASHNCWAYRSREQYERYSDDGEPSGAAGKPIALALEGEAVVDAVVLVVRHFGGIKLGLGGMSRAYSQAARDALRGAEKLKIVDMALVKCVVISKDIGTVYRVVAITDSILKVHEEFQGSQIAINFQMPISEVATFKAKMQELTKGGAIITELSSTSSSNNEVDR